MADKKEKPGKSGMTLRGRAARWLGTITGLGGFSERFEDLGTPWKRMYRENMARLRDNLDDAETVEKLTFWEIMAKWGVKSHDDLKHYTESKRHTLLLGVFLAVLGVAGTFFQPSGGMMGHLSMFSCLSVALLGVVLILTSWWRLDVMSRERFMPFTGWLLSPFRRKHLNKEKNKNDRGGGK